MLSVKPNPSRFVTVLFTLLVAASFSPRLPAQDAKGSKDTHYLDDWTHHRLIFSNPGSEEDAIASGKHDHWQKIVNDPRFLMQQRKRSSGTKRIDDQHWKDGWGPGKSEPALKQDWNVTMLAGGLVQPNMYPAKYSFSTTAASCANDYVVYPTGVIGSATKATISAYYNLYTTGCSGTAPSVYWAYNTGGTTQQVNTSPVVSFDGSQVAFIQSTGAAASLVVLNPTQTIAVNETALTVHFTNGSTAITFAGNLLTQADVGLQISCTGTGCTIPPGDTIASITSTTTGTLASNFTGTTGTYTTVTVHAMTLAVPGVPAASTTPSTCTAACMDVVPFADGNDDTYSAPYYDYGSDTLFVGDDSGYLHKFTGVFKGTPTEVTHVQLNTSVVFIGSPTYDNVSGCVFVGDSPGYLYSVNSGAAGSVCTGTTFSTWGRSELLGNGAANEGIFDGPIVDSTAQKVYAFITDSAHIGNCAATNNCVAQFGTATITSGSTATAPSNEEPIGTGAANYLLFDGDFDNVYYSSTGGVAGDLWAMGDSGTTGASLYRIPIGAASAMTAPAKAITGLSSGVFGTPWASPLTEFCNNGLSPCTASGTATTAGTDYIYFSANYMAATTGTCAADSDCLLGYSINTPTSNPTRVGTTTLTVTSFPSCWGSSGFSIDNSVPSGTLTGASELYLYAMNGNEAGGQNGATSSACKTGTTATPIIYQESQTAP